MTQIQVRQLARRARLSVRQAQKLLDFSPGKANAAAKRKNTHLTRVRGT